MNIETHNCLDIRGSKNIDRPPCPMYISRNIEETYMHIIKNAPSTRTRVLSIYPLFNTRSIQLPRHHCLLMKEWLTV